MALELYWCSFSLQDAVSSFHILPFFRGNIISLSFVCDIYCLASYHLFLAFCGGTSPVFCLVSLFEICSQTFLISLTRR